MTRYSASRGIIYSAPPGADGSRTGDDDTAEPRGERADEGGSETVGDAEPAVRDAAADD